MNYYVMSTNCVCFSDKIFEDVVNMAYANYVELKKFDRENKIKTADQISDAIYDFMFSANEGEYSRADFIYIISMDESSIEPTSICVGYVIVEKKHSESSLPDDIDYFIVESYIRPEYRKRGFMTRAFVDYCYENRGKYLYYVLNDNKGADKFWRLLFEDKFKSKIKLANQYSEYNSDNVTMYSVEV